MTHSYDERCDRPGCYWGKNPSDMCCWILQEFPPDRPLELDIGCAVARDVIFFVRNGCHVAAFDTSPKGVEKTKQLAADAGVSVKAFVTEMDDYCFTAPFDVLFSSGVHQPANHGGANTFSVLMRKPFTGEISDSERTTRKWTSRELLSYCRDWRIEFRTEEISNCMCSGVPHQHAVNTIMARKETNRETTTGAQTSRPSGRRVGQTAPHWRSHAYTMGD